MYIVKDKATGEVIGKVIRNQSLSFDDIMRLSGFRYEKTGDGDGWTQDGRTIYDESSAEVESVENEK